MFCPPGGSQVERGELRGGFTSSSSLPARPAPLALIPPQPGGGVSGSGRFHTIWTHVCIFAMQTCGHVRQAAGESEIRRDGATIAAVRQTLGR